MALWTVEVWAGEWHRPAEGRRAIFQGIVQMQMRHSSVEQSTRLGARLGARFSHSLCVGKKKHLARGLIATARAPPGHP